MDFGTGGSRNSRESRAPPDKRDGAGHGARRLVLTKPGGRGKGSGFAINPVCSARFPYDGQGCGGQKRA
ncbi:hypothetical protein HPP92_028957 [Vanilla planifolia]|uniref:Uncharacterized protein n=1 Tax=Vanilla planifolia TaxID=51239 RepID=A0A835P789_VANPL|nr:hypothetical protein HPP92_028946 [Vanilla planifolia]KAG0446215.1 hypothetical protein HPP92_028957 [Vanilla planifolia]